MSGVVFDPDARAEFLAAVEYYEECQTGLGRSLRTAVEMMIKRLTIGAVIFVGHMVLFTLTYYGRRRGIWLCQSDWILFAVPFVIAAFAYGALFSRVFANAKRWQRIGFASFVALWIAVASAIAGMSVAFTLMGT